MHYIKRIQHELKHLTKPQDFFATVSQDKQILWHDILELAQKFTFAQGDYSMEIKLFVGQSSLRVLENLGFDYNWHDAAGNTFLHYAFACNAQRGDTGWRFSKSCIKYLLSQAQDVYEVNKSGQHLLFYMLGVNQSGMRGKDFLEFIEQYPHFNLHQVRSDGKNLLFLALLHQPHDEVVEFLLKEKVAVNLIDDTQNTLLHMFDSTVTPALLQVFEQTLEQVDLSHKNQWNKSAVEQWFDCYKEPNAALSIKRGYAKWLTKALEHIVQGRCAPDKETLLALKEIIQANQEACLAPLKQPNPVGWERKLHELNSSALASIEYRLLNHALEAKEQDKKRVKI